MLYNTIMNKNDHFESTAGKLTVPVPEGAFELIRGGTDFAIENVSDKDGNIGVIQEYSVYRAASQLILGVLSRQYVGVAASLAERLSDAAKTEPATDIYTIAAEEEHKVDFEHTKPGNLPSRDEQVVSIASGVGAVAHAIAAVELGHESASLGVARAEKVLGDPEMLRKMGSITEHTLNVLLNDLQIEQQPLNP